MSKDIPRIQTLRSVLTVLTPDRAPLILDYYQRNRIHLEPWEPRRDEDFYTLRGWEIRLEESFRGFQNEQMIPFAVLEPDETRMIGGCNFTEIKRGVFQACYLGYSVDREWQGKGLMHEALTAAIDYVFHTLGLRRIMANYMPRNKRSGALLKRLGFTVEGEAREYLKIAGKWEDHVLTSLVKSG